MADWFIVSAIVMLDAPSATQQQLRIPTHDNEIRNHYHNLVAQGFNVISVKILPWSFEEVDVAYEADQTPSLTEVLGDPFANVGGDMHDENTDTSEATGSSD